MTCGGYTGSGYGGSRTASCLVLDVENQLWNENLIGELPQPRSVAAPVTIENVGTYLIGGYLTYLMGGYQVPMKRTSDFLAAGSTEWAAGPALPVDMDYPCAVTISQLSFLIIYGNDIREYQVDTSYPTSSIGWQSASKFPKLQTRRRKQPGCSKIGDQVVIAGGHDDSYDEDYYDDYYEFEFEYLRSAEVLDLSTRTIFYAGDMNSPKAYFHMATITMNGHQTLLAFGGYSASSNYASNSVEQFDPSSNTWNLVPTGMEEARFYFATVIVPRELVCPT